ncbi:MAG: hypothetical protein R3A52_11315 [Polyangiales bacterium]
MVAGECLPVTAGRGSTERGAARGAALHPLRGMLAAVAERCHAEGPAATRRLLGARARLLAEFEPALCEVPAWDEYEDPPELPAPAARVRIIAAVADTLAALSEDDPLLVVIDDLQWADDLTLAALASLGPGFYARRRVLVLGTYRADEVDVALARVLGAAGVRRLEMTRLGDDAMARIAAEMLAVEEVPAALAGVIHRASGGNPFWVGEYLRAVIASGHLQRGVDGVWRLSTSMPDPGSAHDLVALRLARLGPDAAALAAAAAALGRETDVATLADVAALSDAESEDALRELLQRQVLEEHSLGRFRLVHDRLREAALAGLDAGARRALHRRAAEVITARYGASPELRLYLPDLVYHWCEAGEPEREAAAAARAGALAHRDGSFRDALRFFEVAIARGVGALPEGERASTLAWWRWHAGEAAFAVGEFPRAEAHLAEAMRAGGGALPAAGARRWGFFAAQAARHALGFAGVRAAAPTKEARSAAMAASLAAGRLSTLAIFQGDDLGVIAASLAASNLAEAAGEDHPDALAALGYAAALGGLDGVAAGYFARARAAERAANDPVAARWRGRGAVDILEATWRIGRDERGEARRVAEAAVARSRAVGDRLDEGFAEYVLSVVDWYDGGLESMRARLARAAELLGEDLHDQRKNFVHAEAFARSMTGDAAGALAILDDSARRDGPTNRLVEAATYGARAHALARLGRGDEAAQCARRCLDRMPRLRGVAPTAPHIFLGPLEAWRDRVDDPAARAGLDDLSRRVRAWAESVPVARPMAAWVAGEVAAAAGDVAVAGEWLDRAREGAEARSQPLVSALAEASRARRRRGAAGDEALAHARGRLMSLGAIGDAERARPDPTTLTRVSTGRR